MEKTELREQFFAEAKTDPFTHMLTHHMANAWAMGYEEALRDHGLTEERLRYSHSDRVEKAIEWITESNKKAQAKVLIAFAEIAKTLPKDWLRG
jgi:hypothetical protein